MKKYNYAELNNIETVETTAITLDILDRGFHISGWYISGHYIKSGYYGYINEVDVYHDKYGELYGNFEYTIYAQSDEAYAHFVKHHKPYIWDYIDSIIVS